MAAFLVNHEDSSTIDPTVNVHDEVERAIAMLEQTVQACRWKSQLRQPVQISANSIGASGDTAASARSRASDRSIGLTSVASSTNAGLPLDASSANAWVGATSSTAFVGFGARDRHAARDALPVGSTEAGPVPDLDGAAPSSTLALRAACSAAAAAAACSADSSALCSKFGDGEVVDAVDADEALQAEALALRTELRRADARLQAATAEAASVNAALREGHEWHQRWLKETQASIAMLRCKNDVLERSMQQANNEERRLTDVVRAEPERTEEKLSRLRQECTRLEKENSRLESEMSEMRAELSSVREVVSKESKRGGPPTMNFAEQIAPALRAPFRVTTSPKTGGFSINRAKR